MQNRRRGNMLRTYRQKSGLTQRQIAQLLGQKNPFQVSRHESLDVVPSLLTAFGYHVVFRVPMRSLFPQTHDEIEQAVEARLRALETGLHNQTARGAAAEIIAQTLLWMMDRRTRDVETMDAEQ